VGGVPCPHNSRPCAGRALPFDRVVRSELKSRWRLATSGHETPNPEAAELCVEQVHPRFRSGLNTAHSHIGFSTMLTPALAAYEYWANKAPVRTKALTAATLTAASMILAQWITQLHGGVSGVEERRASRAKTAKMFLFGLLVSGPSAHYWHELLERCFKVPSPTHPCNSAALRVSDRGLDDCLPRRVRSPRQ
jgi:hypothetical protein